MAANRLDCSSLSVSCKDLFPSIFDAENRYNCHERYGLSKTKEYCYDFSQTNHKIFYYPLLNKYKCLTTQNPDFIPEIVP